MSYSMDGSYNDDVFTPTSDVITPTPDPCINEDGEYVQEPFFWCNRASLLVPHIIFIGGGGFVVLCCACCATWCCKWCANTTRRIKQQCTGGCWNATASVICHLRRKKNQQPPTPEREPWQYVDKLYVKYWREPEGDNECPTCRSGFLHKPGAVTRHLPPRDQGGDDVTVAPTPVLVLPSVELETSNSCDKIQTLSNVCSRAKRWLLSLLRRKPAAGTQGNTGDSSDKEATTPDNLDTCVTLCGHGYHVTCLQQSLERCPANDQHCPVCRTAVDITKCYIIRKCSDVQQNNGDDISIGFDDVFAVNKGDVSIEMSNMGYVQHM